MGKKETLSQIFQELKDNGVIHSQRDLANALGMNETVISKALKGNENYLTDSLVSKAIALKNQGNVKENLTYKIPLIPINAVGGTLSDFTASIHQYDCEQIISPIKDVTFAIQVAGDSMIPEYPNGSYLLIKQINEEAFIEWGKVYVLDTVNGVVVKEIRKAESSDEVECVSTNPDRKYAPYTINKRFIHGWYRVMMVLSRK